MKKVVLLSLSISLGFVMNSANAVGPNSTYGFFSLPNALFTGPQLIFGSAIQVSTAENNPDIWCNDQGNGYRIPLASDMNELHLGVVPPGYPSNNLSGTNQRKASLSLYNEWGDVTQYVGSGWDERDVNKKFWVAEPSSNNERFSYEPVSGSINSTSPTIANHVVCVADIN